MKNVNLNSYPPIIRGFIKIHTTHNPIRPIANWKEAPAYKLVKMLTKKLGILIPLPYIFNIKLYSPIVLSTRTAFKYNLFLFG